MSRKSFFIGFLMLSLVGFFGILPAGAQLAAGVTMNMDVTGNYFKDTTSGIGAFGVPAMTVISAGGTVTWTNVAGFHTVTSEAGLTAGPNVACGTGDLFDSGPIFAPGATFPHTFTTPGSCNYYCSIHGLTMQGVVTVTPGGTTSTTLPVTTTTVTTSTLPVTTTTVTTSTLPVTTSTVTTSTLPVTTSTVTTSTLPVTTSTVTTSTLPVTTSTVTTSTLPVTTSTVTTSTLPVTTSTVTTSTLPVTTSTVTTSTLPVTTSTVTTTTVRVTTSTVTTSTLAVTTTTTTTTTTRPTTTTTTSTTTTTVRSTLGDVGIRKIDAPHDAKAGKTKKVEVVVKNFSDTTQTRSLSLTATNGVVSGSPVSITLKKHKEVHVKFDVTFGSEGTTVLQATLSPADSNPSNDTLTKTVRVKDKDKDKD